MKTMTHQMTVKKLPAVWRLTCGAWGIDLARCSATDSVLRAGVATVLTIVTEDVSVSIETRTGTHTATRTNVVSRSVTNRLRGTLAITPEMIRI